MRKSLLFITGYCFTLVWNIFTLVEFKNDVCRISVDEFGTCYTKLECEGFKGREIGSCAKGYGVCCQSKVTKS